MKVGDLSALFFNSILSPFSQDVWMKNCSQEGISKHHNYKCAVNENRLSSQRIKGRCCNRLVDTVTLAPVARDRVQGLVTLPVK